jgi:twitching motility protein PilT
MKVARQLGMLLVDERLLTKDELEHQLQAATETGTPLARVLIDHGQVREQDILRVVAKRLNLLYFELEDNKDDIEFDLRAVGLLDAEIARKLIALPMRFDTDGRVIVITPDPFNDEKAGLLRKALKTEIRMALAPKKALERTIDVAYAMLEASGDTIAPNESAAAILAAADAAKDAADRPTVNDLLVELLDRGGSDLHLAAGSSPQIRVNGLLVELDTYPMLKPAMLRSMVYEILTTRQREELEEKRELDCSHPLPGRGRFRVNVFFQRDSVCAVMRAIPNEILPLAQLGMPPVVSEFAQLARGLVLVTGPTGSGKSTTLASIIDLVNATRAVHVITVEDPIEFMHKHKMALVNQREVGADTLSFAEALKHALRQDPDVILVGEMRGLETISTAITAAETGHLVFATLHTQDAPQSIERMIDVFPAHQQQQVRVQLAGSIQAVVSQQLLPTKDGSSRIAAVEVMVATPAIKNLIREGKVHQVNSAIQSGGKYGMQSMDQALAELVKRGEVSYRHAYERAQNPDELNSLVGNAVK